MNRFHVIDDAAAILRSKGVFKQVKVFRRADALYAAHAGGFIRLYKGGGTSAPTIAWDDLDVLGYAAEQMVSDVHGKLSLPPKGTKQIDGAAK